MVLHHRRGGAPQTCPGRIGPAPPSPTEGRTESQGMWGTGLAGRGEGGQGPVYMTRLSTTGHSVGERVWPEELDNITRHPRNQPVRMVWGGGGPLPPPWWCSIADPPMIVPEQVNSRLFNNYRCCLTRLNCRLFFNGNSAIVSKPSTKPGRPNNGVSMLPRYSGSFILHSFTVR